MFTQGNLILVIEEIDKSFYIKLLDSEGTLYSFTNLSKNHDIINVRNLLMELTDIFGGYDRVVYSKDFRTVWDYDVGPRVFHLFIEELFAYEYHSPAQDSSDFDYYSLEQFTEFIEDNKDMLNEPEYTRDNDELPF